MWRLYQVFNLHSIQVRACVCVCPSLSLPAGLDRPHRLVRASLVDPGQRHAVHRLLLGLSAAQRPVQVHRPGLGRTEVKGQGSAQDSGRGQRHAGSLGRRYSSGSISPLW